MNTLVRFIDRLWTMAALIALCPLALIVSFVFRRSMTREYWSLWPCKSNKEVSLER